MNEENKNAIRKPSELMEGLLKAGRNYAKSILNNASVTPLHICMAMLHTEHYTPLQYAVDIIKGIDENILLTKIEEILKRKSIIQNVDYIIKYNEELTELLKLLENQKQSEEKLKYIGDKNIYNVNEFLLALPFYSNDFKQLLAELDVNINYYYATIIEYSEQADGKDFMSAMDNYERLYPSNGTDDEDDEDATDSLLQKVSAKNLDVEIQKYTTDITKTIENVFDNPCLGRDELINKAIISLNKNLKSSIALLGDAGVGKTALVKGIAWHLKHICFSEFRILQLNTNALVSGTKFRGMFESRVELILKVISSNPNLILFIDEFHSIDTLGGSDTTSLAQVLKPYIADGRVKVIGATTHEEYEKYIAVDKALKRRFDVLVVSEPNKEEVLHILNYYNSKWEANFEASLLHNIYDFAKANMPELKFPDKAINLLDEVNSYRINKFNSEIVEFRKRLLDIQKERMKLESEESDTSIIELNTESDMIVQLIESRKTNYSIENWEYDEYLTQKVKQNNIEVGKFKSLLLRDIDFVDDFVSKINKSYQIQRSNASKLNILIQGDASSGKTTFLHTYSQLNNDVHTLYLDGELYSSETSMSSIVGASKGYVGYNDKNTFFDRLRRNVKGVVLIDNYDKGCVSFKNTIKDLCEKGVAQDINGEIVNVQNYIFILTATKKTSSLGFGASNAVDAMMYPFIDFQYTLKNLDEDSTKTIFDSICKSNNVKPTKKHYSILKTQGIRAATNSVIFG